MCWLQTFFIAGFTIAHVTHSLRLKRWRLCRIVRVLQSSANWKQDESLASNESDDHMGWSNPCCSCCSYGRTGDFALSMIDECSTRSQDQNQLNLSMELKRILIGLFEANALIVLVAIISMVLKCLPVNPIQIDFCCKECCAASFHPYRAYFHSAATLNHVRASLSSGFADLNIADAWNLDHIKNPVVRKEHESITEKLKDALSYMKTIGESSQHNFSATRSVDLFMSHEGLHLDYEQQLTRFVANSITHQKFVPTGWYNLGAHMLWIG